MPYLYRRSSAPSSLPARLSSFSFFPSQPQPRDIWPASVHPSASPPPPPASSPASRARPSRSPPLTPLFSLALLSPTRRYRAPALRPPLFPSIFYLPSPPPDSPPPPAAASPVFVPRTLPHPPPSPRPPSARPRKDDTSGAIKSALIAAPDNSIPRVKIIGQEQRCRASVGSPASLDSRAAPRVSLRPMVGRGW